MRIWFLGVVFLVSVDSVPAQDTRNVSDFLMRKWAVRISDSDIKPSVFGDLVFTSNVDGCYDIVDGTFYNFKVRDHSVKIASQLNDTILQYDGMKKLLARNIRSGKTYYFNFRERKFYSGDNGPYITNSPFFFSLTNSNKTLSCLDISKNAVVWEHDFSNVVTIRPLWDDVNVYVFGDSKLIILDKKTGDIKFSQSFAGRVGSEMVINKELILLWFYEKNLTAFDLKERRVRWEFAGFDLPNDRYNHKMVIDEHIAYLIGSPDLYAVDTRDGHVLWKIGADEGIRIDDPAYLFHIGEYLIFYNYVANENILTAVHIPSRKVEYSGYNRDIIPGQLVTPDGLAEIDYFKLKIFGRDSSSGILIAQLRDSLYGFEVKNHSR